VQQKIPLLIACSLLAISIPAQPPKNSLTRKPILTPGEVPWEAFHFEKTKQVLSNVNWNIEMSSNERDPLWKKFDGIFKKGVLPE
jgi:hypothetical protein